jgi:hypothetical protein
VMGRMAPISRVPAGGEALGIMAFSIDEGKMSC